MVTRHACVGIAIVAACTISPNAWAETYRGIEFPAGEVSFADRVVSTSWDNVSEFDDPANPCTNSVGPPDGSPCFLGNTADGEINEVVLEFTDNVLVDIDGPDLHIFEDGNEAEATVVAISEDGVTWIDLGEVGGFTSSLDLADYPEISDGQLFYFVRVRDANGESTSPGGPDLDAVGAIGSVDLGRLGDPICSRTDANESFGGFEFPHGPPSFADNAYLYRAASGVEGEFRDPARAVGGPDGESVSLGAVTSGSPGQLSVFFADNILIDQFGPDIAVVGEELEGVGVEVSTDGLDWIEIGALSAEGTIDLSASPDIEPRAAFQFLRLTGSPAIGSAEGPSAGADIDAIGAISSCDPVGANDTDGDGVPDEPSSELLDFDGDGVPDAEDTCPADATVAQTTPLEENQRCNWPGSSAGPGFIVEQEEGCSTASAAVSGWPLLLIGLVLGWSRRRREREKNE